MGFALGVCSAAAVFRDRRGRRSWLACLVGVAAIAISVTVFAFRGVVQVTILVRWVSQCASTPFWVAPALRDTLWMIARL